MVGDGSGYATGATSGGDRDRRSSRKGGRRFPSCYLWLSKELEAAQPCTYLLPEVAADGEGEG